jgi:hypothetical protein
MKTIGESDQLCLNLVARKCLQGSDTKLRLSKFAFIDAKLGYIHFRSLSQALARPSMKVSCRGHCSFECKSSST